jgi:hypothetical protein
VDEEEQSHRADRAQVRADQDLLPVDTVGDGARVRQQQRADPGVGGQCQAAHQAAAGQLPEQAEQRDHDEPVTTEDDQLGSEEPAEVTVTGKD